MNNKQQPMELPSHLDQVKGMPQLNMNDHGRGNFSDYEVTSVMEDTLLVRYVDGDGAEKTVGGIIVQTDVSTKMWRVAEVLKAGPDCKSVGEGDHVIFPFNNPHVAIVKNLKVGDKSYKELLFVKENIVFCKCKPLKK